MATSNSNQLGQYASSHDKETIVMQNQLFSPAMAVANANRYAWKNALVGSTHSKAVNQCARLLPVLLLLGLKAQPLRQAAQLML